MLSPKNHAPHVAVFFAKVFHPRHTGYSVKDVFTRPRQLRPETEAQGMTSINSPPIRILPAIASVLLTPILFVQTDVPGLSAADKKQIAADSASSPKFDIVTTGQSPFPMNDRRNLSVYCGGGKGVLISSHWVLTASHCITSNKAKSGDVQVRFTTAQRKPARIGVDLVIRHKTKDLALLRLKRPVSKLERPALLLLRQTLVKADGKLKIKKVAGSEVWREIPAVGAGDHLRIPRKEDRRGKAGSSGGPWIIHSAAVGDVLVGITHGGGYAPQVAWAAEWIQETVTHRSSDRLYWATKTQALDR